jgi:hypothetical protein
VAVEKAACKFVMEIKTYYYIYPIKMKKILVLIL